MGTLWTLQSSHPGLSLYSKLPMAYTTSIVVVSVFNKTTIRSTSQPVQKHRLLKMASIYWTGHHHHLISASWRMPETGWRSDTTADLVVPQMRTSYLRCCRKNGPSCLTDHPPFAPPNMKSILVQDELELGAVNPIKVAKFLETLLLGACARKSSNLKSLAWFSTLSA